MRSVVTALSLIAAGSNCLSTTSPNGDPAPNPQASTRILFVGNSLTYFNDLPGMVKALADSAGIAGVQAAQVAKPDYSLEDHWNDGQARRVIEGGGWTHVVMQQGPSAVLANRANLRQWAATFAEVIRNKSGVPAMFSVWPQSINFSDFPHSIESYRLAAEDINGLFLPGGGAWLVAFGRNSGLPLYGPDGLHPSVQGSYLAALAVFGKLFNRSVIGLPRGLQVSGGSFQLTADQALLFQQSADEANGRTPP
jgi:hypothetical protein